jgi:hypothetical protein
MPLNITRKTTTLGLAYYVNTVARHKLFNSQNLTNFVIGRVLCAELAQVTQKVCHCFSCAFLLLCRFLRNPNGLVGPLVNRFSDTSPNPTWTALYPSFFSTFNLCHIAWPGLDNRDRRNHTARIKNLGHTHFSAQ